MSSAFIKSPVSLILLFCLLMTVSCKNNQENNSDDMFTTKENSEMEDNTKAPMEVKSYTASSSKPGGIVYEVLPGPAVLDSTKEKTPFSNNINKTSGEYNYSVTDISNIDSPTSKDSVSSINIRFKTNDGKDYLIENIKVAHKEEGSGEHTYFGGVGLNQIIHGNTMVGTNLEPKLFAYIALWGVTDLKDANSGEVVAKNRKIHIMTTNKVRTKDLKLMKETDLENLDISQAETHIILPPVNLEGNKSPIPRTDHGFIHLMFENVELSDPEGEI